VRVLVSLAIYLVCPEFCVVLIGSEEADLSDRIDGSPGEMGLKPTDLQPSDSKFASVPHLPCHNRFHIPVSVPVLKP